MIPVYFPSDVCVDDVVNIRTNNQFVSVIAVHFSARVCWIIKRTVFNVHVCLIHSMSYAHNQFERRDEKQRHRRRFFKIWTIFIFKRLKSFRH